MEILHKSMGVLAQALPEAAFLSFDAENAFNSFSRQCMWEAVGTRVPTLLPTVRAMYAGGVKHLWFDGDGTAHDIESQCGADQGCPLSPPLFAVTVAPALEALHEELATIYSDADG